MLPLILACATAPPPEPTPPPEAPSPTHGDAGTEGTQAAGPDDEEPSEGLWNRARDASLSDEMARLEAIGYVGGDQAPGVSVGVTVNEPTAWQGVSFYVSGHAPEARLIAMDGTVLHQWRKPFEEVWPDRRVGTRANGVEFWRRAKLLPGGEILAIYEGHGLVKLDRDSNVIWSWAEPAHHDLEVLDDGRIWVLARKARVVEDLNPRRAILEDFAVLLGPDGKEQKRVSLLEAVRATAEPVMNHIPRMRGDIFHTNSLEVLDGRVPDPRFKAGNLLLSARVPSVVFVVDPDLGKAVWWNHGEYRKQHDPSILPDGHMLLFDNIGLGDGRSAVRELTVPMMEEVWSYRASEENPFFSRFCGAAQRLPNGNTLISESGVGRVLEVDPAGKVVWRFDNPARAGENQEFVAIVPELVRLPASVMDGWTPSAGTP